MHTGIGSSLATEAALAVVASNDQGLDPGHLRQGTRSGIETVSSARPAANAGVSSLAAALGQAGSMPWRLISARSCSGVGGCSPDHSASSSAK
jgi:hypothetical protein